MTQNKHITIIDSTPPGIMNALRELGGYQELIWRLVYRGIKVRYTQSVLGIIWVLVEPILSMIVFTLVFSGLLNVESGTIPYPLFSFSALIIWGYLVSALNAVIQSLTMNTNLVNKIYVPRLILPIVGGIIPMLDLVVGFAVLVLLMLIYGAPLYATIVFLPIFIVLAFVFALSLGLWLSIVNIRYRDVGYGIPMLMRVLIYSTPVVYAITRVPENWRWLYDLNPMVQVVQGFRWCLLQDSPIRPVSFLLSTGIVLVIFFSGLIFFQRSQNTIVDRM